MQTQHPPLPPWLLEPMEHQVLSPQEAQGLWENYLLSSPGQFRPLPANLHQAAQKLFLWEAHQEPSQPLQ